MEFIIGSNYIIKIESGAVLTYTCQILSETESFVTFKDIRFGKTLTCNKLKIISFEKIN